MADHRSLSAGSASGGPTPPRRKAFEHPGRFAIVAIGLLIVLSLVVYAGMASDTSPQVAPEALPAEIASVQPDPNTLAKPQQSVEVDLRSDLSGVLVIDGVEIPEDQLSRPTQSSMVFQPGPDKAFSRFGPGNHLVHIVYWPSIHTRDQAKSFSYSFRTTA